MKKSLLFVINVFAFLFLITSSSYAVKHTVNVGNYYFNPATLNVQVGDTIRWVWVQGSHTTTSTTIPAGAPSWDEPMNSNNTVYEYRVSVAGVYNYLCTPHSSTQIGSFTATAFTPTLSVSPSNQNVNSLAGSTNFSVTSNSNWTATSNVSWCTVTSSGSGNSTLTANFQTNNTTSQRIATITISVAGLPNITVTVTQAGAAATLTVTPSNQNVSATAGSTTFSVSSNSNWTALSSNDWCVVTQSGTGNGTITANYQANTLTTQRVANITVSVNGLPSQVVTVSQEGAATVLQIDPLNRDVTAVSGTTSFSIVSNANWQVISDAPWASATADGTGNGTILVDYEENTDKSVRVAVLTVSAPNIVQLITITQEGTVAADNIHVEGLKIFPNPSNGLIDITSDILSGKALIQVMDIKGNIIHSQDVDNISAVKLDLSNAAEGTYLIKIKNDEISNTSRIVILK